MPLSNLKIKNHMVFSMITMCFSIEQIQVGALLNNITSGKIAIPEIQRPFVWDAVNVRDFLDSLFRGFPTGYLITWKNSKVGVTEGTAKDRYILIDGQQRVKALQTSLLGFDVMDKNYNYKRIIISFHPITKKFQVANPIEYTINKGWVEDISKIFDPKTSLSDFLDEYCTHNPGVKKDDILVSLLSLQAIETYQIGKIDLFESLSLKRITEIFIRINSKGVPLSQADFVMSKIAANKDDGGDMLRNAIDHFCHLASDPSFYLKLKKITNFTSSEFFPQMDWLHKKKLDIYIPSYSDMLRVAFTTEFKRGPLKDLVALLSGRNFETKEDEDAIVKDSFRRLKSSINRYMNEFDFNQFLIQIQSAGFVKASMISSQNALNFAYIIYLTLREQKWNDADIMRSVRRWFVMSLLTGRYSGSPESKFGEDIEKIHEPGIIDYFDSIVQSELSDAFWEFSLPEDLKTSAASSPYFHLYQAAQINKNDKGFLSDSTVEHLVKIQSDVHHLFPRDYLKNRGKKPSEYNQIANYVVCEKPIDIAISNKEPREYFKEIFDQCNGGQKKYGNIADMDSLHENFRMNCIPEYCISEDGIENMTVDGYSDFLAERRKLMSQKIKKYFEGL